MIACIIGVGGIGAGYDFHDPSLLETHFSALSSDENISYIYCVDINGLDFALNTPFYQSLGNVTTKLLRQTDLFIISTPTSTHLQVISELMSLRINRNSKFVLEKPVGSNLREARQIQDLLANHEVFVNYIRRSSKLGDELLRMRTFDEMHLFNCIFEGEWANIGSHFIDFFLFANKSSEKLEVCFTGGILKIICNGCTGRFERTKFKEHNVCPYKFEIKSKTQTLVGTDGGNTVRSIDHVSRCERTVISNGLQHYQKLFYDRLFDPKRRLEIASLSDAINVHTILEKINE